MSKIELTENQNSFHDVEWIKTQGVGRTILSCQLCYQNSFHDVEWIKTVSLFVSQLTTAYPLIRIVSMM